ncbi:MAG: oxidoreductase domain protein [Paenibacillaceae bacterium]|nr:oxidoreductase domain protein [Paenibacillaceae bacterium]
MNKPIKLGVVGTGRFAQAFIPLFQAHPWVSSVAVADLLPERRQQTAERFGITGVYASMEEMLGSDIDAIAIFAQRHLHGPLSVKALQAGKHVYCAVPMASSIEEMEAIIAEVAKSGLVYMTGETSYYYPCTVYNRQRYSAGDFGHFVYGEAQYLHDMSHGFYESFQHSGGTDWKKVAGFPPMYYPTHSVSMILSATGARATHVSCLGYKDRHEDGIFQAGGNLWDNAFSNETALMRTSDGGMCRFNEFRRVGWSGKASVYLSMYGTLGSYEEHAGSSIWTSLQKGNVEDLSDLLACQTATVTKEDNELFGSLRKDLNHGVSKVHPVSRLPQSFAGLRNGHFGSHQFLADDFVKAAVTGKQPPNHAWAAAKYCVPGLIAHESAMRDGEMLPIPDLGEVPASFELLNPEEVQANQIL